MVLVVVESVDPDSTFRGRDVVLPLGGADLSPSSVASFHDEWSNHPLVSTKQLYRTSIYPPRPNALT